ncbi:AAA domain-containing protein, partial [Crepidotus variabilis]
KNFCIITPYDAQRSVIQTALEKAKLPWESVYNLDSFQVGNEADYVLISVVRSSSPGFLRSVNRMNVMLTRCRKGMVIVSNRGFLEGSGGGVSTLLGQLLAHWRLYHDPQPWVNWREVSQGTASLPGSNLTLFEYPQPSSVITPPAPIDWQKFEEVVHLKTSIPVKPFLKAPSPQIISDHPLSPLDDSTPVWPSLPARLSPNPSLVSTKATPRPKVRIAMKKESKERKPASGFIRSITVHDSKM